MFTFLYLSVGNVLCIPFPNTIYIMLHNTDKILRLQIHNRSHCHTLQVYTLRREIAIVTRTIGINEQ